MSFVILLICGLSGIGAHWYVRYSQQRTTSTFIEYLSVNRGATVASVSANLASVVGIFQSVPSLSVMSCVMAYLAGYALDSKLNKDAKAATASLPAENIIETIKNADKNKSLDDLLDDDSRL